ncbi:MAG: hypothetical protein HY706_01710 [Candidatus Hydrogenedentes bacterium]|nr:hypothetical protein [Candidatus Hydrogenedentota bacterium]
MNNCWDIRATLQTRFDAGESISPGLESHLASCAICRDYALKLETWASALHELPTELPRPGFERRCMATVEWAAQRERDWRAVASAAAALLVALAIGIGWWYPLTLTTETVWSWISDAGQQMYSPRPSLDRLTEVWKQVIALSDRLAVVQGVANWKWWTALAGAIALFTTVNGIEAMRLRSAGADTPRLTRPNRPLGDESNHA